MNTSQIFFGAALCLFLASCNNSQNIDLKRADQYTKDSQALFEKAVGQYQQVLKDTKDPSGIYLALGKLFYQRGRYKEAIENLSKLDNVEANKLLALAYYKMGNFTDALSVFNKIGELADDEYLYNYGLTCEEHNLFDQARKIYQKIQSPEYSSLAKERLRIIDALAISDTIKLDPLTAKLIAESPSADKYPQAGGVILSSDETIEIKPDNTMVSESYFLLKILNERGKKYGEVEIDYDSTYEKVELEYAHTIKPDGQVVSVGQKHIRDVSKYLNFPLYSNARVLIISMPEITEGAFIEYKIKRYRSYLVNKKDFFTAYFLQESEPILQAKFVISLPKERTLNINIINEQFNYIKANLNPQVKEENGKKIFSWEFKDIPQIIPEPSMPSAIEVNPTIMFSTFDSWDEIYHWWWDLAKDKITSNDEMKKIVSDLIKDKDTQEKKARAVYNWCIQNIRYVGIEYGQAGHEPHSAIEIFKNKYGDCKDQAILLVSLLKEAGVEAYPVLILTEGHLELKESFPMLFFDHAIAAVNIEGQLIFLDPTAETVTFGDLPGGDQDKDTLVFLKDKWQIKRTPLFEPKHNLNKLEMNIKINPDESISAERNIYTFGYFDQAQRYWLRYTQPILYEETLKEKIHAISPGAKLIDYKIDNIEDIDKPIKLSYRFAGPEFLVKAGKARVITQLGDIDLSLVAKDSRDYNIDLGVLDDRESSVKITLPKNLRVRFLPENVGRDTKWLDFINQYDYKGNELTFTQKIVVKDRIIKKEEYAQFKKLLEGISKDVNQCIVLEESQGNEARK